MVTPRSKGLGGTRKELKGVWKHGYTRNHILSCIIDTPRTSQQIAEYTGIDYPHVKVVISRLHKRNKVIRDDHTHLCAPHAVPSYLQNIPDNAEEDNGEEIMTPEDANVDLDALYADYAAAVAAGMFEDTLVEAPVMVIPPAEVFSQADILDIERCKAHNEATDWAEYKTWWERTGNDIDEPFEKVRARAELASVGIDMSNYNSVAEWARYELTDAVIMKIMPSAMDKWSRQYMWPAERKAYVEYHCGPALAEELMDRALARRYSEEEKDPT
jgi:hypothetical protein